MAGSGRMTKGDLLTSKRVETSKTVLDALRNVESQGPDFLKECASKSLQALEILRRCDDRPIVEELIDLVLDGCALVYIVIRTCWEHRDRRSNIARDMRSDAEALAQDLNNMCVLVAKKTTGSFYRRKNIAKQNEDTRKIAEYHKQLLWYMPKFGHSKHKSIHDSLEEMINARLQQQDEEIEREAQQVQESVDNIRNVSPNRGPLDRQSNGPWNNTHDATGELASGLQNMRIVDEEQRTHPVAIPIPTTSAQPMQYPVTPNNLSEMPFPVSSITEREMRALAEANGPPRREELGIGDYFTASRYEPSPNSNHGTMPSAHHSPVAPGRYSVGSDIYQPDDEACARAIEEEERRKEAEEREEKEKRDREDYLYALRLGAQEQLLAENDDVTVPGGQIGKPPRSPATPSANFNPLDVAGAMSFSNVHGSGISVGGGPVHVYNGGGNVTNNNITGSYNTRNVRHYYTTRK